MNSATCEQIEGRRAEVRHLCQRCQGQRLELFGSATLDRFDSKCSDLDLLVGSQEGFTALDKYFLLTEGLEDVFEWLVDLVIEWTIRNPYFRQTVNATRHSVYDDRSEEVAARAAAGGGIAGTT